ncbi:uncharacterized protein LOC113869296 [Abrus precatorius]|uniref:Uncharacterized protein LOC113869296 n=1 Tax=Abrus precatorius TaxID=3816 RepID=A0A8B8LYA8_ABRPR|nr:uncharacterized protein LOC113869296 [Abrus precatorius]
MSVGEYAAKFDELSKYCPYFAQADDRSRCSKFESGLRPDIKQAISCHQVQHFPTLVDRCRIYENDTKARQTLWKQSGPHRPAHSFGSRGKEVQEKRKPYFTPTRSYWSEPVKSQRSSSGSVNRPPLMCYNYGGPHFKSQCRQHPNPCPKCQRTGHLGHFCRQPTRSNDTISTGTNRRNPSQGQRNSSNQGEVRSQNPVNVSPTSVGRPSTRGRVFTMSGAEAAQS